MIRCLPAVFVTVFAFFGVALSPVQAALLSSTGLDLLRTHLGENVNVTNIYTKAPGDISLNWHSAVDGRGRTFTLMEITGATTVNGGGTFAGTMIVGGYDPQSWASSGGWNETPNTADRTAFLFNITQGTFIDQKSTDFYGHYQTYNGGAGTYGPYFGYGADLYARNDMVSGLVNPYSYGLDGTSLGAGPNILGTIGHWETSIGQVETYVISAVPLPPSAILFGTALFGMGAAGLRRNRKAAKKSA